MSVPSHSATGDSQGDGTANVKTESLSALESCRPLEAQVHCGEWFLRLREWEKALHVSTHSDQEVVCYVCAGIREGFQIGFVYCRASCRPGPGNMNSVQKHEDVVERYIGVECEARRVLGPLEWSRFPGCMSVHLGLYQS